MLSLHWCWQECEIKWIIQTNLWKQWTYFIFSETCGLFPQKFSLLNFHATYFQELQTKVQNYRRPNSIHLKINEKYIENKCTQSKRNYLWSPTVQRNCTLWCPWIEHLANQYLHATGLKIYKNYSVPKVMADKPRNRKARTVFWPLSLFYTTCYTTITHIQVKNINANI